MASTFQILRITGHCDNPIRNATGELVFGNHTLWEGNKFQDGDKGSLAPNVFSYDFASTVNSAINVDVSFAGETFDGGEYCLQGLIDGHKIFLSDFVTIGSNRETTFAAKIVDPQTSPDPFSWNADVSWELQQKESTNKIDCADKTRLELYWIAADIHEVFLGGNSGIPVTLLRSAILGLKPALNRAPVVRKSNPIQNEWAVRRAFEGYSKKYDTIAGASHFGVNWAGQGTFLYNYYVLAGWGFIDAGPGSGQPIVNCYDQAAMVQVLSTLSSGRASWLFLQPFGYINTTNLIGIGECNNPFFQVNYTTQIIGAEDTRRTSFGNHAFNGALDQFNAQADAIYDGCAGSHFGTETAQQYLSASIDTKTNLYRIKGGSPGTVANIRQFPGVVSVNKPPAPVPETAAVADERVVKLVQKSAVSNPSPRSQAHWDDLPKWVNSVLGDQCVVAYHELHVGKMVVEALWHLTGVEGLDYLVVRVRVETRVGEDGKLDVGASSRAASARLIEEAKNTEIDLGPEYEDIDKLWAPAKLDDYADHAIQYAPEILQGRILIASGNTMIDIRGGISSEALVSKARSLLKYTTVENHPSAVIPQLTRRSIQVPEVARGDAHDTEVVKGVGTSFEVKCQVEGLVSNACARAEDFGLLLSKTTIEINPDNKTSTVTFSLVTRTLGTHNVDCQFAVASELTVKAEMIQVNVIA